MNINGRVLLLLVVTGVFMRVWTVNERPRGRFPARPRIRVVQVVHVARTARVAKVSTARAAAASSSTARSIVVSQTTEEEWTEAGCPISLPSGITPGTYRVVNDNGRVARLVVLASETTSPLDARIAGPDHYALTVNGVRWHLIRLQDEPALAFDRVDVAHNAVPASRKFDFTGYVEQLQPAAAAPIEQAERPRPPAMPLPL